MRAILTVALKDLRLLWRDRYGLFWALVFPLLFALFFGSIYGGLGERTVAALDIAAADEDGSEGAKLLLEKLAASRSARIERLDSRAAREAVRRGRKVAYVVVPKGFGDSPGFFGGGGKPLELGIDPSRRAEGGFIEGLLMEASFAVMQKVFSDPREMRAQVRKAIDGDPDPEARARLKRLLGDLDAWLAMGGADAVAGLPMSGPKIETVPVVPAEAGPRSPFEITFPSAVLWGVLGCCATFAISIVVERTAGTFLRLRVSPLSRGGILAGKGLACFLACAAVSVILLAVGRAVFGVRLGQLPLLALAIATCSFAFTGLMMFISTLGRTEQSVGGAGWAILTVLAMLGGGMIPLIAMPGWLRAASHASPVKWGILALEGAIWRGFTPLEMLLPCGILIGVGLAGFAAGVTVLSRSDA